jgi:NAD(P)-dependent dehydrogenase (short-subunit alcohol dehydrogenase family)
VDDGDRGHEAVWLVTGAGRGLGRALVEAVLDGGDRVVAGVRRTDALVELVERHGDRLLVVRHDVRDRSEAFAAVAAAVERFGRLDVVVNNAGYGLVGTIEEVSAAEAEDIVATDLFGALWTTQAALPQLRAQGRGHIVQISTVGAVGTMPSLGLYNAAKWGLEGFSEALAAEVAGFGIRVTIAEVGGVDTDWAGPSMRFASPIGAYDELRTALFGTAEVPWPAASGADAVPEVSGDPEPDAAAAEDDGAGATPAEAAAAIVAHVRAADGPLRLLVGEDAPVHVAAALALRRDDYARDGRFTWPGGGPR